MFIIDSNGKNLKVDEQQRNMINYCQIYSGHKNHATKNNLIGSVTTTFKQAADSTSKTGLKWKEIEGSIQNMSSMPVVCENRLATDAASTR